jgi:hypothetical protein
LVRLSVKLGITACIGWDVQTAIVYGLRLGGILAPKKYDWQAPETETVLK